MRKIMIFLVSILLILSIIGCSTDSGQKQITIGGKSDTESRILANLAKHLLRTEDFKVETKSGVKSVLARQALEKEEVDLYYEYTGTAYTVYHQQSTPEIMTDPQLVYNWVADKDQKAGLVWLDKIDYNNTYTLMMRQEEAQKYGIETISDLAAQGSQLGLTLATDSEFYRRPDGFKALKKDYGLEFSAVEKMSAGIIYKALKEGKIDVGMGYSTDGRIKEFGFVTLEDDQGYFPVYNPAPVVRQEVLANYPQIEKILNRLTTKLTTAEIQKLNKQVDIAHESPDQVAKKWLQQQGLID